MRKFEEEGRNEGNIPSRIVAQLLPLPIVLIQN